MGDLPLRTPTHRRLGGPLPRLLPNGTHPHPSAINLWSSSDVFWRPHKVLFFLSKGYPLLKGRLDTRYSPVRRSSTRKASFPLVTPRLACVKPVASVHPEPGSNSSLYNLFVLISLAQNSLFFISLQLTVLILILYVQENHLWSSQFLYYFLLICKSFKELLFVAFSTVLIRRESGRKDKTFYFKPPNVFGSFF